MVANSEELLRFQDFVDRLERLSKMEHQPDTELQQKRKIRELELQVERQSKDIDRLEGEKHSLLDEIFKRKLSLNDTIATNGDF